MRLIDADALQKEFREKCTHECAICRYGIYGDADFKGCDLICNSPAIEDELTGHWAEDEWENKFCSNCGMLTYNARFPNFCSNCGANLRGGRE